MLCYRAHHHQVGVGQRAKRYVPVPAVPLPHFVLVQADLSLGLLETILYDPAPARDPDQLMDARPCRSVAQIVGDLLGLRDAPTHQQPASRSNPLAVHFALGQRHARPVIEALAFGSLTGRGPDPGLLRQALGDLPSLPLATL